jgi:hypothetical protein
MEVCVARLAVLITPPPEHIGPVHSVKNETRERVLKETNNYQRR